MNKHTYADDQDAAAWDEILRPRRLPRATYRIQLNRAFKFRDAESLIPYWHALGISDLYLSPISQACAGSTHGYDICEHTTINPELGGAADFARLCRKLKKFGMGLILDVVPNHMGISDARNLWWMDVLENGPSSPFASYFDIDWNPVNTGLKNKLLLPILEDQYGSVLESGKFRLTYENGSFSIYYGQSRLPVAPRTYSKILARRIAELSESMGADNPDFQELQSILTALRYLPPQTEQDAGKVAERNREKEVIKRRIATLCDSSAEIRGTVEATVEEFNGIVGDPRSFDNLDALIGGQIYRPAFWKVAAEEINYRRFFDVNDLAAIRMEDPEVFKATHAMLFELLGSAPVTGLRIDHADGLRDPTAYLRQVQLRHLENILASDLCRDSDEESTASVLSERLLAAFESAGNKNVNWPLYVIVEKILTEGERLPSGWATYGTTGYDFLNTVNGIFVDCSQREELTRVYSEFTLRQVGFDALVNSTKKMIMLVSLPSEIYALGHQLNDISERNRRYRDFTLDALTFAIREVIASLKIYRTYIRGAHSVSPRDRGYIEAAVRDAKKRNPRTAESLFEFVRDTLLLDNLIAFPEQEYSTLVNWVMKFQQISGPVMAKGSEDTAFYIFNRLVSLNEVGGDPGCFGTALKTFHQHNEDHCLRWPYSMLASTTHDTKRSEDVRARINVLSEIPEEWGRKLSDWARMNSGGRGLVDGESAPDPNDEYLFYQTLLGAWPADALHRKAEWPAEEKQAFHGRMAAYMHKAIKEAKSHTNWINPNREYDRAVHDFVMKVLESEGDNAFEADFLPFARTIAHYGKINALAQLLLKLTCPGVPDIYQGSELWDLRLVDPDNRGPVDYRIRASHLRNLIRRIRQLERDQKKDSPLKKLALELLQKSDDGRIKLYIIFRALDFRRLNPEVFSAGNYIPLSARGEKAGNVCAFSRTHKSRTVVVVVPRLLIGLTDGKERAPLNAEVWGDTALILPNARVGDRYRNLFTGGMISVGIRDELPGIPLSSVFEYFPVALLDRMGDDARTDNG